MKLGVIPALAKVSQLLTSMSFASGRALCERVRPLLSKAWGLCWGARTELFFPESSRRKKKGLLYSIVSRGRWRVARL